MDTINKVHAQRILALFMLGVIGFMGYMTFTAVMLALGNWIPAALSIFLFDGGAYAGYQMYVGNAAGAPQRHTALVILWADFILAGFMVAGGLTLLPPGFILVVMLVSAVFNGGALYLYKTTSPEMMQQAQEQDERDAAMSAAAKNRKRLAKEAARVADMNIQRQAPALGNLLSLRATAQLKYDMRLPMTEDEVKAWNEEVIDAEELPAALPAPASAPGGVNFWSFLSRFFGPAARKPSRATHSPQAAPRPSHSPEPTPDDTEP